MDQVFSIWDRPADMARDLGEKQVTVRAWKKRGSIPANRDLRLITAARARGRALTADHLALLRAGVSGITIPTTDVGAPRQDATPEARNFTPTRKAS